eukprot:10389251-Ditylum_brightwellii.AAC.1
MEETVDANGTLIDQQSAYNKSINAEVQLHHQDHITTVYKVEFPDREVKKYAANTIAENMLMQ